MLGAIYVAPIFYYSLIEIKKTLVLPTSVFLCSDLNVVAFKALNSGYTSVGAIRGHMAGLIHHPYAFPRFFRLTQVLRRIVELLRSLCGVSGISRKDASDRP